MKSRKISITPVTHLNFYVQLGTYEPMQLFIVSAKIKDVIHPVCKDFFPTNLSTGQKSSYPMLLSVIIQSTEKVGKSRL